LTKKQLRELEALDRLPDDQIDLSDAPEVKPGGKWFFFRDRHKFLQKDERRKRRTT
jgi:hypothetical protein